MPANDPGHISLPPDSCNISPVAKSSPPVSRISSYDRFVPTRMLRRLSSVPATNTECKQQDRKERARPGIEKSMSLGRGLARSTTLPCVIVEGDWVSASPNDVEHGPGEHMIERPLLTESPAESPASMHCPLPTHSSPLPSVDSTAGQVTAHSADALALNTASVGITRPPRPSATRLDALVLGESHSSPPSPAVCQRVWLCTPPNPAVSPGLSGNPKHPSLSTECIRPIKPQRPNITTRAMSTGRLAREFDGTGGGGAVMCLSAHSERILYGKQVVKGRSCWREQYTCCPFEKGGNIGQRAATASKREREQDGKRSVKWMAQVSPKEERLRYRDRPRESGSRELLL